MVIGGILSGVANLAGAAGEGGERYYDEALDVWEKVNAPDFDLRSLSPPELRVLAEQFPQLYEAVVPEEVRTAMDSPELRQAQLRSLGRLEQVAEEGMPEADRLAAEQAQRTVGGAVQGAQRSVLRNLAARGRAGGGSEIAARMQASQTGANLARDMGSDLARQSMARRLQASAAAGDLAGGIRGQDVAGRQFNADVVNRHLQYMAGLRTQAARDAALSRERAQSYNVGQRQRVGDTNVLNRYQTNLANLERRNRLTGARSDFELRKAGGLSGAYVQRGQAADREREAKAKAISDIGGGLDTAVLGLV